MAKPMTMNNNVFSPGNFFNLKDAEVFQIFEECEYVWDALHLIQKTLDDLVGNQQTIAGRVSSGAFIGDRPVYIHESAVIEPGAYILGPAYIGPGVTLRHGAYVRENVIMLTNSGLGHSSEAKNSIFLPGAHAPHFNYVGDSILGIDTNLGAGTKLSNLTMISQKDPLTGKRPTITFSIEGVVYDTGLTKLGAIIGDRSQTGCNSVLNPGCLIGPDTLIYANLSVRKGYYPPNSILKLRQDTSVIPRK